MYDTIKMYDTIILGGGIAGISAAIYAARKRMDYLLITKNIGGQMLESGEILNYPGIKSTTGSDLAKNIMEQVRFNNVKYDEGQDAKKIIKLKQGFKISAGKKEYRTKTIIIATGAKPRKLDIAGEDKFFNKGLTYCSVCDGPLFKGMDVAVIGGGNAALEAADFMQNIAKKIYIINIGDKLAGYEYLVENVKKIRNLDILNNAKTIEIIGDSMVSGIRYEQDGVKKELKVKGVIVEIGRIPNTGFVKGFLDMDEHGHIKIDCQTNTSMPGIFSAGDCTDTHEYQYVIAAGQGCTALLKAARYLAGKR